MASASKMIQEIEQGFDELSKEYNLFHNGLSKFEPLELREDLLDKVKRLRRIPNLRTEEKFRSQNLLAKLNAHTQLWDKMTERRFMGKPRPGRKPPAAAAAASKEPTKGQPESKKVVISDPGNQRDQVVDLFDEYMRLNLLVGNRKMTNFTKFQAFIHSQTDKIRKAKNAEKVQYEVLVQNQKVVIKSRSVKKKPDS